MRSGREDMVGVSLRACYERGCDVVEQAGGTGIGPNKDSISHASNLVPDAS